MSTQNIKDEVRRLLERLPDNLTWDELVHEISVHNEVTEKEKTTSDERPRRPPRMQLSREEVLKRMKESSKRKEQFLAAARAGKS